MSGQSSKLTTPLLVAATLVVVVVAMATVLSFRDNADACRRTATLLVELQLGAARLSALEWEAMAERRVDAEALANARRLRKGLSRDLDSLESLHTDEPTQRLRAAVGSYARAVSDELSLVRAGRVDEAAEVDRTRVDPAHDRLSDLLEGERAVHTESAERSGRVANLLGVILAIAAGALIVLLIRRYDSARASALAAAAAKDASEHAQQQFRSLVRNSSDVIMIVNDTGTVSYASSSAGRVLGRSPEELENALLLESVHRSDRPKMAAAIVDSATDRPSTMLARVRHGDGKWRFMEVIAVRRLDDPGIRGTVVTMRDVTGRHQAEEALEASEERYRRLVEAAPDAIIVESRGKLVFANSAAAWLLGANSGEEIVDRQMLDFILPERRDEAAMMMAQMKKGSSARTAEEQYMRLDGITITVELAAIPTTFKGRPATQIIFRDVTERKEIEQLKSDFVAMVSHELRSPLSVIVGNSWVIERFLDPDITPPPVLQAARRIRERGNLMTELVESLLDLSQIQAGTFILRLEDEDIGALIDRIAEMMPMALGHELAAETTGDIPPVRCDARRLGTAVTNLVSNAVKYSPQGGKVRLRACAASGRVRISVSDEGIGISQQDFERIFQRFTQADMSAARSFAGVGLGLYLVNCIARAHNGSVEVESEIGVGSTFTIDIPIAGPST